MNEVPKSHVIQPATRSGARAGFAHLSVLFVCLFLASIAAAFVAETRSMARDVRNNLDIAQLKAIADGAIWTGFVSALADEARRPISAQTTVLLPVPSGRRVQVSTYVFEDDMRSELNDASKDALLATLTRKAGLSGRVATPIVDAIIMRRERYDAQRRVAADSSANVRAMAFETVDALRNIPGVTEEVFSAIAPHVTAMGMADWSVEDGQYGLGGARKTLRIQAIAHLQDGTRFIRTAVLNYPLAAPSQYRIDVWKAGPTDGP